jgi:hypothetical protein
MNEIVDFRATTWNTLIPGFSVKIIFVQYRMPDMINV